MDHEISENHKRYIERKTLFKNYGYDVDEERKFIIKKAKPIRGRILEAGTGKGHFSLALAEEGHVFVSFDISEDELRIARFNLAYFGHESEVEFRIENGKHTSFINGSFDVIFSVNVLHHLANPYRVIDELIRILAPNGKLVIADFTDAGFTVMDKIHALEGNTHGRGNASLSQIESYLQRKIFTVRKAATIYQQVLIAGQR